MGKCDAGSGVLFSACLPVSQSLWSDARCRDAGSRVVSPAACLPVCGQMPDAVTPAAGSCLPLVSLCLPDAVTLAPGSCLPLVSLCLPDSKRETRPCSRRRSIWRLTAQKGGTEKMGDTRRQAGDTTPTASGIQSSGDNPQPASQHLAERRHRKDGRHKETSGETQPPQAVDTGVTASETSGRHDPTTPDAVTGGSCLPLVSLCLPVSAVTPAWGSSGSCLVFQCLCCQMPVAVTLAPGWCVS